MWEMDFLVWFGLSFSPTITKSAVSATEQGFDSRVSDR